VENVKRAGEQTEIVCPKCGEGHLIVRIGKAGSFVGCSKFPTCTFTSNFTRAEDGAIVLQAAEEPTLLDEKMSAMWQNRYAVLVGVLACLFHALGIQNASTFIGQLQNSHAHYAAEN